MDRYSVGNVEEITGRHVNITIRASNETGEFITTIMWRPLPFAYIDHTVSAAFCFSGFLTVGEQKLSTEYRLHSSVLALILCWDADGLLRIMRLMDYALADYALADYADYADYKERSQRKVSTINENGQLS